MPTKEIATWEPTRVVPGEILGLQDGPLPLSVRVASRVGELQRSWSRAVHDLRYRPPKRRATRKLLVLVPAHNEADTIRHTLHALLTQTQPADRIVVVADNCSDDTAKIASRYRGVTVWRQQLSLLSNGVTRLLFAFMLTASLMVHQYVWAWFWAIPPAIAALLNLRQALIVPNRTAADVISSALLIPVELYLMFRVACATASWATVLSGIKRDAWASQARAEAGLGNNGAAKFLGVLLLAVLVSVGAVYGWLNASVWFQRVSLTTGWYILATATVIQTAGMLWRIVRRNKKNRPWRPNGSGFRLSPDPSPALPSSRFPLHRARTGEGPCLAGEAVRHGRPGPPWRSCPCPLPRGLTGPGSRSAPG
jgi:hypothetical protein